MQRPVIIRTKLAALLLLFLLGACGPHLGVYSVATTRDVTPEKANYVVRPDKALIVFVRPKILSVDAAVLDITDGCLEFVASFPGAAKLA